MLDLPESPPLLTIRNLCKSFGGPGGREVLRELSLDLAMGEYIAIVGESGSGKSTLLNLIAGLDEPDRGSIAVDGAELKNLTDDERTRLRAEKMGFVFQAFHLLPHLTVAQNVALPLVLLDFPDSDRRVRVNQILASVNLADRAQSLPRELSGGEMQRVAIARALVHKPKLLLADEPTGNLDQQTAGGVLRLLRERIFSGAASGILVTHSAAAAATTDRVYELKGKSIFRFQQLAR